VEKKEPLSIADGNKLIQPLWKTVWRVFKKLKIELPHNPTIPLPGDISKRSESTISKRYLHPYIHCSIIYNS